MRSCLCVAMLVLAVAPAVVAQEGGGAKPAEMDEGSKQAFDRWHQLEYHLGRAGVKKAAFKIQAQASMPKMGRQAAGNAAYRWDGTQGTLDWDNPTAGQAFGGMGWRLDTFNRLVDPGAAARMTAGCKLTAKTEGDRTVVSVEGTNPANVRSFGFDKDGVMDRMTLGAPDGPEIVFTLTSRKEGKHVLRTGWSYAVDMGGGKIRSTVLFTWGKSGEYHVVTRITENAVSGEEPYMTATLELSEHKFNDDVK